MTWDRTKGRPEPIRALNKIREIENGEPLVLITDLAPKVRIARESVIPYLRQTVVEMLARASEVLPENLALGVVDAWRPFERQKRIYQWMWESLEAVRPDMPHAAKRRTICRFVAPVDQKAPPGHCTGAAVDVWLLDSESGDTVDVTSPFERLAGAPTYVYGLNPESQKNRDILVEAMLGAGFSNCRDEWWHYSFGDAGWAVRMGESKCRYGLIELPSELYERQEQEWIERMKERPNPFLDEGAPAQARPKAKRPGV